MDEQHYLQPMTPQGERNGKERQVLEFRAIVERGNRSAVYLGNFKGESHMVSQMFQHFLPHLRVTVVIDGR